MPPRYLSPPARLPAILQRAKSEWASTERLPIRKKKKLSFHTHTRARRFATPPPAAAKKKKTNKLEKHNQTFILRVTKSHIILVLPSAIGVSMLNDESHYTQYSFSQSEKHTTNKTVCVSVLRPRMQVKAIHKIEMEMSIKCVETHLALIILYVRHKHTTQTCTCVQYAWDMPPHCNWELILTSISLLLNCFRLYAVRADWQQQPSIGG